MLQSLILTTSRAYRLARLASAGPGAWRGYLVYAIVLGLSFVGVWVSVRLITWNKAFYDALEQLDGAGALRQIGIFATLIGISAACSLVADWLRKLLWYMWRDRLTGHALDLWLDNRSYWIMRPGFGQKPVENPDQRVAEDCRLFIDRLLGFTLDLLSKSVALVSYFAILWSLSGFALNLTLWGTDITIQRYMFWAAPVYVLIASLITHALGKPLKHRYYESEKVEADFRHRLVQLRDKADLVAQSGGEAAERRLLDQRFRAIMGNWRQVMRAEFVLGLFQRPYQHSVLRLPTFFALPIYFAGSITLGGLMQLASAFSNITTTLSWFIFNYKRLAGFVAVCERLDGLMQAAENPAPLSGAPQAIRRDSPADTEKGVFCFGPLQLATPAGCWFCPVARQTVERGQTLLITGASGQGKTTLLSALAGLWPWGEGSITDLQGKLVFLPAGSPVMADNILDAVCHPANPADMDAGRIRAVLEHLGLTDRLDLPADSSLAGMSMGERQRIGLARAVLNRPEWLLMDEATSALDAEAEAALLVWLRAELPDTTIILVAHRIPTGFAADKVLQLGPKPDVRPDIRKVA